MSTWAGSRAVNAACAWAPTARLAANLVRGSIAFMDAKYDGNVTNVFDGTKVNGYDRQGVRGRLDITPDRSTDASC